jgi:hypothetical protein
MENIIFTIGGRKNSKLFCEIIPRDHKYKIIHIDDDIKDKKCKSSIKIKKEIYFYLKNTKNRPIALISFARNTVSNSVENIAKTFDLLSADKKFKNCKFIGPFFHSAKLFSNKWTATKKLKSDGYNVLDTIKITKKCLINKEFKNSWPAVLKATNLTGGIGMYLIKKRKNIFSKYKSQIKQGIKESILTEYLEGPEISFELLSLGNKLLMLPMSIKESTNLSLDHGDSKIKICGYLKPIKPIYNEVVSIAKKYKINGYFATEGILYDLHNKKWKIMEAMTRFTGSYPMINAACYPFNAFNAIFQYIDNKKWQPEKNNHRVVIQLPVFKKNIKQAEKMVNELKQYKWIISARVEDMSKLPLSSDKRVRIQTTFKVEKNFSQQLKIIEKILKNHEITKKIHKVIFEINSLFPELVYNKKLINELQ